MASVNRRRLRTLIPRPDGSREVLARLAEFAPEDLAALIADTKEPWWRRRACTLALTGRVPAPWAADLFARACDPTDVAEVRRALLAALASSPAAAVDVPLLTWLRGQEGREEQYGVGEAILAARAELGDPTVVPALTDLAFNPWAHRRVAAEAALDRLVVALGEHALLQALGAADLPDLAFAADRPAARLLGVRLLHRAGLAIDAAFADPELAVARAAHERIRDGSGASDEALLARVDAGQNEAALARGEAPPIGAAGACLWALLTLAARGHDVRGWWRDLGEPRAPIEGVPEDIRLAILRIYLPGERTTDPRLLLEGACIELPPAPDADAQLARALAALDAAGLDPQAPVSAGDHYQQGEGTYHVVVTRDGDVELSTLGPWVRSHGPAPRARAALAGAGFTIVEGAVAGRRFAGLPVYFFGSRDPLTVGELLFYWQD